MTRRRSSVHRSQGKKPPIRSTSLLIRAITPEDAKLLLEYRRSRFIRGNSKALVHMLRNMAELTKDHDLASRELAALRVQVARLVRAVRAKRDAQIEILRTVRGIGTIDDDPNPFPRIRSRSGVR